MYKEESLRSEIVDAAELTRQVEQAGSNKWGKHASPQSQLDKCHLSLLLRVTPVQFITPACVTT